MTYTPKTWVTGETIEAAELNHMEQGIAEAVQAATGTGTIGTQQLADGAVTTAKIADNAVTETKLGTDVQNSIANKANIDGSYTDMTVGLAEQLQSNVGIENKTPYNFRTSGGSVDIGDRERVDAIVGGTVVWNQLCNGSSTTVPNGHKYIAYIGGSWSVGTSNGTALSTNASTDKVFDITQMYGTTIANYIASLTSAQAISWFCGLYPKAKSAAYSAPTMLSVKTSAHKMVGFNQWDEEWEQGTLAWGTGANTASTTRIRSKNYIPCIGDTVYYVRIPTSAVYLFYYDADKNFISYLSSSKANATFTTPSNARYIRFFTANNNYGTTYNNDICINIHWDGERDGEYEAYQSWIYALDSDLELRGVQKLDANNKLYYDGDTYEPDGTVTRNYEYRAYTSGDESLANAITDGTHTVVKLATPTTESADPYQQTQNVSDWGTEEYVDERKVAVPVGHNTFYQANLKAKLETAPDSPSDGDGLYVVQQISGENTYVPLVVPNEIPDAPTTDGTYVLKATVSDGTATYSWVSE